MTLPGKTGAKMSRRPRRTQAAALKANWLSWPFAATKHWPRWRRSMTCSSTSNDGKKQLRARAAEAFGGQRATPELAMGMKALHAKISRWRWLMKRALQPPAAARAHGGRDGRFVPRGLHRQAHFDRRSHAPERHLRPGQGDESPPAARPQHRRRVYFCDPHSPWQCGTCEHTACCASTCPRAQT